MYIVAENTVSSVAIGDRHFLKTFLKSDLCFLTKFSVTSVHLHQSSYQSSDSRYCLRYSLALAVVLFDF